jgi:hypothetical protein
MQTLRKLPMIAPKQKHTMVVKRMVGMVPLDL